MNEEQGELGLFCKSPAESPAVNLEPVTDPGHETAVALASPDPPLAGPPGADPAHLGEMADADSVGTAGNTDCGDLLRMWVKFREDNGRKVIDKASFQTFGCQTAIAVASLAAEMVRGKTAEEALALTGEDLAAPLGPLPPMKVHCAQLVEGALRSALSHEPESVPRESTPSCAPGATGGNSLMDKLCEGSAPSKGSVKIRLLPRETH